jgi:hypothetical protein
MDEKATVKQALQTPLVHNEVWQPIATAWFDKWKAYVNYNDDEQVSQLPLLIFQDTPSKPLYRLWGLVTRGRCETAL